MIGRIPSAALRLRFLLSVQLGIWTEGGHRDWEAIRVWADQLKPMLRVEAKAST